MSKRIKPATVVGVFETRARAEQAIADLKADGFTDQQIGMVARNAAGEVVDQHGETLAEEGAVTGAVAGAGAGAIIGAGVLAGVIPVVGPVLAIGALGTVLLNAVGGAAIAGLAGALIGWGIPEDDAAYYESEVKAGRFLVTVEANGRAEDARTILHRYEGFDRTTRTAATSPTAAVSSDRADRTVELKEEKLRTRKEKVETGDVTLRKEVHTERQTVTVPVEREELVIERRSANRPASGKDISTEEIRIPLSEEHVRVSKDTVVQEEVTVGKRKVRDTETVAGDVRKEELVVESDGKAKVRQTKK